jgi:hypothetical protein
MALMMTDGGSVADEQRTVAAVKWAYRSVFRD